MEKRGLKRASGASEKFFEVTPFRTSGNALLKGKTHTLCASLLSSQRRNAFPHKNPF